MWHRLSRRMAFHVGRHLMICKTLTRAPWPKYSLTPSSFTKTYSFLPSMAEISLQHSADTASVMFDPLSAVDRNTTYIRVLGHVLQHHDPLRKIHPTWCTMTSASLSLGCGRYGVLGGDSVRATPLRVTTAPPALGCTWRGSHPHETLPEHPSTSLWNLGMRKKEIKCTRWHEDGRDTSLWYTGCWAWGGGLLGRVAPWDQSRAALWIGPRLSQEVDQRKDLHVCGNDHRSKHGLMHLLTNV